MLCAARMLLLAQFVDNELHFARTERARGALGQWAKPWVNHHPSAHFAPCTMWVDVGEILLGQFGAAVGSDCEFHDVKLHIFLQDYC